MELLDLSMLELAQKLDQKDVSAVEVTQKVLARIAQVDGRVKAFVSVDEQAALASARASDERRAKNVSLGVLDGVPLGIKDNIHTLGQPTTCASKMLKGYIAPFDSTVTRRLKDAGATLIGKLNLDEFAMGSSCETSAFGPTYNPWNLACTPGGSSGGSAAAVAAREVFAALGTDTGGSIRQPAAFTNTVGLKPTYGRVSRFGVVAYASSLDQVGPMTRTVADAAALLSVLAGPDARDSTCASTPPPDFSAPLEAGVSGMTLGLPKEYFVEGMDAEVEDAVRKAAAHFEKLGARVVEVSLPHTSHALSAYYLIATAEASSNLARYDGIRFGHRAKQAAGLRELYEKSRAEGFGAEVKRRIMLGTYALSAGYYDAYYLKAQKVRTLISQDFQRAFSNVDAILCPASPIPPFRVGEKVDSPLAMYLTDVLTLPCNLAGLPGLSIPCGFTRSQLPIGLQILGRPFDEAGILRIGRAFERDHDFVGRAPTLN